MVCVHSLVKFATQNNWIYPLRTNNFRGTRTWKYKNHSQNIQVFSMGWCARLAKRHRYDRYICMKILTCLGVKFGLKILLRVNYLTFCNSDGTPHPYQGEACPWLAQALPCRGPPRMKSYYDNVRNMVCVSSIRGSLLSHAPL